MANSINNNIPFVPENTIDPASGLNESLNTIDALLQLRVLTVGANTPPGSPAAGDRHIVGTAPTGAWAGQANKLARYLDSAWSFFDARYAVNAADGNLYTRSGATWAVVSGSSGMTNPMTSVGDLIVGGSAGTPTRLAKGSALQTLRVNAAATALEYATPAGGDVAGPASSTDNAIARFDTTTGKLLQNSTATLGDAGELAGITSINGGQLAGLRNKIINGNPLVNQRAVSGTVTLAAGAYGHDRWKAGASGCTYTFATTNNVTTLTITAGSLQQVIEGANLQSGAHTLSWSGTAQGKIGAGSYSASGVTVSVTGGTNTTIEFGTGTLSLVQFEPGSTATQFEQRHYGAELGLCLWYFRRMHRSQYTVFTAGMNVSATQGTGAFSYEPMRTNPTGTVSGQTDFAVGLGVGGFQSTAVSLTAGYGFVQMTVTVASGLTANSCGNILANAASGAYIDLSAEL